jgi:hypothetical protein
VVSTAAVVPLAVSRVRVVSALANVTRTRRVLGEVGIAGEVVRYRETALVQRGVEGLEQGHGLAGPPTGKWAIGKHWSALCCGKVVHERREALAVETPARVMAVLG